MLLISRSRFLRPASEVYSEIIWRNAPALIDSDLDFNPFSLIWRGIRCLDAMVIFSSSVYPERLITSIRSNSADGMLSVALAVRINITFDRSKGKLKK